MNKTDLITILMKVYISRICGRKWRKSKQKNKFKKMLAKVIKCYNEKNKLLR